MQDRTQIQTAEEIKRLLVYRYGSLDNFAKTKKISYSRLHQTFSGYSFSSTVEEKIAKELGISIYTIREIIRKKGSTRSKKNENL